MWKGKHGIRATQGPNPRRSRIRRAFSLVELLVVLVILGVLFGLLLNTVGKLRSEARTVQCMNNLRQVAQGIQAFYADHLSFPDTRLRECLAPYIKDAKVFICPEDLIPEGDSYSQFYVWRQDDDTANLRICCPRHRESRALTALFGAGRTVGRYVAPVKYTTPDGEEIAIDSGDTVGQGTLSFDDGSTADVGEGLSIMMMTSFRKSDGKLYSVLKVDVGEEGNIDIHVTPGSRFEVVTPAAIAGVRGTHFRVVIRSDGEANVTLVEVYEGVVEIQPLHNTKASALMRGNEPTNAGVNAIIEATESQNSTPEEIMDAVDEVTQTQPAAQASGEVSLEAGDASVTPRKISNKDLKYLKKLEDKLKKKKEYKHHKRHGDHDDDD